MRILFIVDGRSPIALNWMAHFARGGHEIHLATTFDCRPDLKFDSQRFLPVAFSAFKKHAPAEKKRAQKETKRLWSAALVNARTRFRQWLGPLTLPFAAGKLAGYIADVQPDLVHAMRIPYEGMLAAAAFGRLSGRRPRFLISIWGNDFTLHAAANPWMDALTRSVLQTADALHTDCFRDQRLAGEWGFNLDQPAIVLPGAGGIQMDVFYPPKTYNARQGPLVINPRGFRAYVRSDTFFRAVPFVLREFPETRFVCPAMQGVAQAERWVDELGIRHAVSLLPQLTRRQMADWFRQSWVAVSPATHDGTPNTLLEAMACGCFPVAGDLESVREWVKDGENGLLFDSSNPRHLADTVLRALRDDSLRRAAGERNRALVLQRAEYGSVMRKAESFYESLL